MEDKALKLAKACIEAWERGCDPDLYGPDIDEALAAIKDGLARPTHRHAEGLAKLGWQYFECPACGSEGARAFQKLKQDPAPELLALLIRYRRETPLGHQPHMIAHEADEAIAKATGGAV